MEPYNVNYIKKNRNNLQIRLEIKSKGPPRPPIKLTQKCRSKEKHFNRAFKKELYDKTPWLCGCEEINKLFCFPCLVFEGLGVDSAWSDTGVDDLTHLAPKIIRHSQSRLHLLNELQLASIGRVNIRTSLDSAYRKSVRDFNKSVDENRYILRRLIDCVLFCGAFQVALRGHDESTKSVSPGIYRGLVDFVAELDLAMKQHLSGSSVFKGTSKSIQNDILDAIYKVCIDEIESQIKRSEFVSIQADETTDCSNIQQLVFIVRYVYNGKIYERFVKFLQPKGYTAILIADEIFLVLNALKIDENKLISQSYDGASVMTGSGKSVQIFIRDLYPNACYVHSYAHPFNLILERSASINHTIRSFFCNLHAFPTFFTRSNGSEILREIVHPRIPAAPRIQWNYNTRTVTTIYKNIEPLKECMRAVMEKYFTDHTTFNQAQTFLSYLCNEDFLYWLNFFANLMPHCDSLFKCLQLRSINSNKISEQFYKFETTLNEMRNTPTPTPEIKLPDNVDYSIMRKEVCDVIQLQIKNRFIDTDHILASKLFYADKFADYNKSFPMDHFNKIILMYNFLEKTKLKNELSVIYSREDFYDADGAFALLQYFIEFSLESVFEETMKLLKIVCTIPMMTTEKERCFTSLNRVKTFIRNTVIQDRLDALCMISIEKRLINSISDFHSKVIDIFCLQKDRRMAFIYK